MISINPSCSASRSGSHSNPSGRRVAKSLFMLPVIGCVLACASCNGGDSLPGIEVVADTQPIGAGLKVIGFALVGASVVVVIGRLIK